MRSSFVTAIAWLLECLRDGLAARKGVAWSRGTAGTGKRPTPGT